MAGSPAPALVARRLLRELGRHRRLLLPPVLDLRLAVRADHRRGAELDREPVLISETSALPSAGQPAKMAELFAGIRLYGLLGMVWFDSGHHGAWRLSSPAAITAFRRGATTLRRAKP